MTTDRETLRVMSEWLQDGRTALPDHVLDAVLERLPTKPQRRPWWPARRYPTVNALPTYAITAAAVVVVAVVGFNLLRATDTDRVGASPSPPASSSSPSSVEVPLAPSVGTIDAGRYRWAWDRGQVTFTVPEGWIGLADGIGRHIDAPGEYVLRPSRHGTVYEVTRVYADACRSAGQLEPIGPTVGDLVTALNDQVSTDIDSTRFSAGTVVGNRIEIRETPGLDRSTCRHGAEGPLQIWADPAETTYFALTPRSWGVVYAFDVDGTTFAFNATFDPQSTDADEAEVDAIVSSFELDSTASSLSSLRLPGTTASPGGDYGWEGGPGSRSGMHLVASGHEVTALVFTVGADCLRGTEGRGARPVRISGFDGVSVEPYEPPVTFIGPDGDETTRAFALSVADRTLCVFLTWHPTTTEAEVAAAAAVLDTLRAEPVGEDRIRIVFTLDEGWDTG